MAGNKNEIFRADYFDNLRVYDCFRLFENHYLNVIFAPASCGKTISVERFFEYSNYDYSWFSVSKNDNRPKYFWRNLCKCFGLDDYLDNSNFPDNIIKTNQFFDFIKRKHTHSPHKYIIIDNFNHITNPLIHKLIKKITLNQFDNIHIILMTNKPLPETLENLSLVNLLNKIDSSAFELNAEEIKEYFLENNLDITERQVSKVLNYSRGKILLVNFAMRFYIMTNRFDMPREFNALIEQVELSYFSKIEIEIIKALSVFDEFDINVASFAISDKDPSKRIMKLAQKSYLLEYNKITKKYRISGILKTFLKMNSPEKSPQQVNIIHQRAGYYLIRNGFFVEGINELNEGENFTEIINRFKELPYEKLGKFSTPGLINCSQNLSEEMKIKYFLTLLSLCVYLSLNSEINDARVLLEQLVNIYKTTWLKSLDTDGKLLGEINIALFFCCPKFSRKSLKFLKTAEQYLTNGSDVIDQKINLIMPHVLLISSMYDKVGELKSTLKTSLEISQRLNLLSKGAVSQCYFEYLTGEYFFITGNFEKSKDMLRECIENSQRCAEESIVLRASFLMLHIFILEDNLAGIEKIMEIQQELLNSPNFNKISYLFELLCVKFSTSIKQNFGYDDIEEKISPNIRKNPNDFSQTKDYFGIKDYIDDENCEKFKIVFENEHSPIGQIQLNLLEVINLQKNNEQILAKIYLKNALEIAQYDNIISPFMMVCDNLIDLLKEIKSENIFEIKFISQIIDTCERYSKSLNYNKKEESITKISLTSREIDIAKALVECKSNKEMAINFNIKEGTVKKLIYNLYQKMEVNSRSSAVKKIIEYGIANFN